MACKTKDGKYSKPIKVDKGDDELKDFKKALLGLYTSLPVNSGARNFLKDIGDNNVFLFDRKLIERFKSLSDFKYYAICLGFNENGATAIFGAFNETSVDGETQLVSVKPTGDEDCSLSEHPQRKNVGSISKNFVGNENVLTITLLKEE